MEDNKLQLAKQIYKTLCEAIEAREWSFNKDEERLAVYFEVNGEDIPIKLILIVDAERQLIRLLSPLPFDVAEDKRMDMAIAVCAANYGISDGGFDYDISEGSILFRLTSSFRNSVIGEGLLQYMLSCACVLVDKYNDQFLAINKGVMDISQFLSKDK
ncbi:MAG: hypothetical protein E7551_04865 [Ruminococcaceae bacterium]|nr:hypothetical protein [Oscillospiraceae bacterium]